MISKYLKMRILRIYCTKANAELQPRSVIKVFRKLNKTENSTVPKADKQREILMTNSKNVKQVVSASDGGSDTLTNSGSNDPEYFVNLAKVQMISNNLHKQIFPRHRRINLENHKEAQATALRYLNDLRFHGIDIENTQRIKDVLLNLPKLHGDNLEDHFYSIAMEQIEPYQKALLPLVSCNVLPKRPIKFSSHSGWTEYDSETGKPIGRIDFPIEEALVLDIEVCVREGATPILATAVGCKRWYSWVSPKLFETENTCKNKNCYELSDLIPLGTRKGAKIIIGHNVSYDRARLRESYLLEDSGLRFLDTMSLHVCVSGITSYQRAMLKSKKETPAEDIEWTSQSSLNSLVEVHKLYCEGIEPLSKEPRNIFVEGTLVDIRKNFQNLMAYCAGDVEATHRVLSVLYPLFKERFPHPVTLAGILEMGSAYLPVNSNWQRYINESNLAYEDLNIEAKYHLSRRADEACSLLRDNRYRQHLWLWDEDWSVQELKMKQGKSTNKKQNQENQQNITHRIKDLSAEEQSLWKKFEYLYNKKALLPARRSLLPGYPAWYRKLCLKPPKDGEIRDEVWSPGATELSTGMQIAPKLLSLCWEGYPLHYIREHGWGFLVPCRTEHPLGFNAEHRIPLRELSQRCPVPEFASISASEAESAYAMGMLPRELDAKLGKREFFNKPRKDRTKGQYTGSGVWCNQLLEGCCYFIKLPHKNGNSFRVGNPLSRDFLNKFSENVLSSGDAECNSAARVIEIARMMSYWRNNRDRIIGQMVVWLKPDELPSPLKTIPMLQYGAICPQIVVCGTLTRRASEPTWMTASNSQRERIGSELRAIIQAPPTYKIVGADVDSQELWIASVLGDAYAYGIHGATPLGWMTLSGSKSNGTDMHSITAKAVSISRDHAKVINYARIYGAGQNFAEGLLKQFNPTFSGTEAKNKAAKMFSLTKGKRYYRLREDFQDEYGEKVNYSTYEAMKIAQASNRPIDDIFYKPCWQGGTESAMFNRLEEIAMSDHPVTPFLGCRLSRALEVNKDSNERSRFLPTRINWVVQSGAVDFLHLMLVSMRWLMGPHARFCLSFHDELRYLVKEDKAYKAALAMHITNLLTRAFCSSRIGLADLPMSCAFFSSVEVDTVLRKESTMDCVTPSNPHGLKIGYGIQPGESLNIYQAMEKAGGNDLSKWEWIK